MPAAAQALCRDDGHYRVRLGDGSAVSARTIVLATEAQYRKLPVPRLEEFERALLLLETSAPGVFAVGDVRSGSIKRVASAVGEGSMAVRLVHEHLATQGY
ncbi:MAG: hypothetical protein ACRDRP_08815 [Pseudonocardiaceae bacterium]